jgi:U4/U6 small nuclear ribonucleoprotein PRP31
MSLADELMNDLDGLSDDGAPSETEEPVAGSSKVGDMGPPALPLRKRSREDDTEGDEDQAADSEMKPAPEEEERLEGGQSAVGYVPAGGTRPAEELDRDEVEHMNLKTVDNVEAVVKLHKTKRLQEALSVRTKSSSMKTGHAYSYC